MFWEFWVCPIVCSTGEEWGSNEFESSREVLGLELGDEEFKCKEFWPKFLDGSGREEEKGLTRLPEEDASMAATPSGAMDASIRIEGVGEGTSMTWALKNKGALWDYGVWLFSLVEDRVGVLDSSNKTCREM